MNHPIWMVVLLSMVACDGSAPGDQPQPREEIDATPFTSAQATLASAGARCQLSKLAPPALRRLTRREIDTTLRDVFPGIASVWQGPSLGPDALSNLLFSNDHSNLLVDAQTRRQLAITAKEVATLATLPEHLGELLPCALTSADEACAAELVDQYGPLLYRRPLTSEETSELLDYQRSVAARSDFPTSLKWTLVALLQSPHFLYRSELGDHDGVLTQFEIASQLAYAYGGSTPTPELLERAARGELRSPDARTALAHELLQSPRGQAALLQFFREWTGFERVLGLAKDQALEFSVQLAPQLVEETRRFFASVVLERNASVAELLTEPTTFLNGELLTFYGYGLGGAEDFTLVERPAGRGVGLLAQASILAGRAHYDFTSPVFRGLFVYSQLLCREPQPRPLTVPELPSRDPSAPLTTRERFESLHGQGACATCHQAFEPFGYALEQFDHLGRFRIRDHNIEINARTQVVIDPQTTLEVDGLEDLARQLAALPEVTNCVSGLLASYVFAGAGGQSCLAESLRSRLAAGELGLRDYYVALSDAPSFTHRAWPKP